MTPDASRKIAEHVAAVRPEDIPQAALDAARRATLDTVGCMLAGVEAPGVDMLIDLARGWGGKAEASIVASGFAAPAPLAAWINGAAARALEIDDCTDFLPVHPSATIVPILLALAEARGGMSGRDFLVAAAIGQDLIIRLGMATRRDAIQTGRYNLFRIFGAAAAAAKALRLDADRTHNALGIAYSFMCGEGQSALDGALALRLTEGNSARGAIDAALLAEKGFTGARDYLLGRMGFFNAYEPDPVPGPLTENLGAYFWGEQLSIKPFAACRCNHAALGLILAQRREAGLDPKKIKAIRVTVAPGVFRLVGAQLDPRNDPPSQVAAQFSLSYTLAAALLRGDMFLKELAPAELMDPEIRGLAKRIEVVPDEAMVDAQFVIGRTAVEIDIEGEGKRRLAGFKPPGNPANPLDMMAVREKFDKCAAAVARPLPAASLKRLATLIDELETLPDAAALSRAIRG
ncbi:MAG: MmgE/PrpD family protein [Alphaproteobacteria bacterium]|nr:MmgE/PrpD family protein [Alphaproteobacteria bacterium]